MTPDQYRAALSQAGLSVASKATAAELGVTVRTAQRYASGATSIPVAIQLKLASLGRNGDLMREIIKSAVGPTPHN